MGKSPKLIASPTAISVWARLLRPEQKGILILNSQHPKAFVMATLYMLHVELSFRSLRPKMENGEEGIDNHRRDALKRFAKWVPCNCQPSCSNEWNFANDIGLARGGASKCKIDRYLRQGALPTMLKTKEVQDLKAMYESWKDAKR